MCSVDRDRYDKGPLIVGVEVVCVSPGADTPLQYSRHIYLSKRSYIYTCPGEGGKRREENLGDSNVAAQMYGRLLSEMGLYYPRRCLAGQVRPENTSSFADITLAVIQGYGHLTPEYTELVGYTMCMFAVQL